MPELFAEIFKNLFSFIRYYSLRKVVPIQAFVNEIIFIKLSYSLLLLFMTDLQVINHMFYEFDQTDGDFHERSFFFWFIHLNSKKDFKIQMKIFESKQTL